MIFDVAILGGGPGGYVAAIKAAQLGLSTCLIEKKNLGGACLNVGCIPTKYLLTASNKYTEAKDLGRFGVLTENVSFDMDKMVDGKENVVNKLTSGVQYLMKKNGIEVLHGEGILINKNEIEVKTSDSTLTVFSENIVIATGTRPAMPEVFQHDGKLVCSSDEALNWRELPEALIVVGGGVIGCEFATIFSNLGVKVTIVELLLDILANFDTELSKSAELKLKKSGVEILTGVSLERIEKNADNMKAVLNTGEFLEANRILVSIGRTANIDSIGLEKAGVELDEKGRKIAVNNRMQTNVDGIYAIGDVCNSPLDLAHVAMREGLVAVENIMMEDTEMDYRCIPNCVFTTPELATVGLTSKEAENRGINTKVGKFSFMVNGKALSMGEAEGFVKIVADEATDEILGAQIIGPHATDLIAEVAVLVKNKCKCSQLAATVHAHPTLAEVVWEASESVYGKALHS